MLGSWLDGSNVDSRVAERAVGDHAPPLTKGDPDSSRLGDPARVLLSCSQTQPGSARRSMGQSSAFSSVSLD